MRVTSLWTIDSYMRRTVQNILFIDIVPLLDIGTRLITTRA